MRICFLIGSVDISGGSYVIFQHAQHLHSSGHKVVLGIQLPFTNETTSWHPAARELQLLHIDEAADKEFDIVIATWWRTALELPRFKSIHYIYFVQSIESRFYNESEEPLRKLVDSTYSLPLHFVTEATWIKEYLLTNYDKKSSLVKNGIRKDFYTPQGPTAAPKLKNGGIRVLIEGPFGVSFKNTGQTIKVVKQAHPSEIWVLTSTEINWLPGVDRVFSRVPITEVANIYRSCDVIVKLSYIEGMFGPPLELFHCGGTAIVYEVTGHDEYIQHGVNGLVARKDDEETVVKFIERLGNDPSYLEELKRSSLETATKWPSWNQSSKAFLDFLERINKYNTMNIIDELDQKAANAWKTYSKNENSRLKLAPSLRYRNRLHLIFESLPIKIKSFLRRIKYTFEIF